MKSLRSLSQFKISKKEQRLIGGGNGETNKYTCTVKYGDFQPHTWNCFADSVSQCKNPVGRGKQTCVRGDANPGSSTD
ncbi:hypothetical protein [Aquimarina algiphila]|uniref:hypothetical protein n=1 Tax=Aquimarina algiphila TaxID=2047982 RepID=UPI002490832A|nr:hypothetical protein [Aquimarina algiphila]